MLASLYATNSPTYIELGSFWNLRENEIIFV